MQIREFKLEDYSRVIALWQQVGLELNRSDSFEGIKQKLERDPDLFLVAHQDGQLLAAVMAGFDGRRGWVYHVGVHPFGQGQGLGKKLFEELENRFKNKGCEKVNVLVEPGYGQVRDFFARLGYKHDDLVFMEKWLN